MSGGPLSVALLNPCFVPERTGTAERVIHELGVNLLKLGLRPRVIVSHRGPYRRSIEDGVPVTRHWRPPEAPWTLRNIEPHLSHLPLTYASLKVDPPDLAHAFHSTDALAACRWEQHGGGPSVFSCMGDLSRETIASKRLRKTILERVIGGAAAVTAISRSARDALWRWFGVEAEVVYPGVDLERLSPRPERSERPTIACLDEDRAGAELLTRAFRHVRRGRPDARLVMGGPDTRAAWVSGTASTAEAFDLSLLESLAGGMPVFCPGRGSAAEIVDRPEIGRLFHGDDEHGVARAILEVLELAEDPATARSCRERAEEFNPVAGAKAYMAIYREVLV